MKREIVQDFLNLPGIVGLALMGRRSRPYFYGVDRSLNFQQKEALARGIQQIIDTTPANFEAFEFQFSSQQVYLYKLDHGTSLLVLATDRLTGVYTQVIQQLKLELQQDMANAVVMFRLLAEGSTLSGQNYWKPSIDAAFGGSTTSPPQIVANSTHPPSKVASQSNTKAPAFSNQPVLSQSIGPSPPLPDGLAASAESVTLESITLQDLLAAMNVLSQFAIQYLGPVVVTNYWKATRPEQDWLHHFSVERSAQLTCSSSSGLMGSDLLTAAQQQWLQEWVGAFVDRCTKVIRDFSKALCRTALDDRQKRLLLRKSI